MRELRVAVRSLVRQPGMAALAVVALGLGIGLTTTMFSIVNGAVLRGLPFPESDRILHHGAVQHRRAGRPRHQHPHLRRAQGPAAIVRAAGRVPVPVRPTSSGRAASRLATTAPGSPPTPFACCGSVPRSAGIFRDDDSAPGAAPVVIIGDKVWQEQFGGSPEAIGQALRVNGTAMTVVGVMPPKFRFPGSHDIWPALIVDPAGTKFGEGPGLETIGRLRPGLSMDEAGAEMAVIWRQLEQAYPDRYPGGETVEVKTYIEEFIGSETAGDAADDADGGVRRAADCLRQRGQPGARPRRRPHAGGGGPHRDWRHPLAGGATDDAGGARARGCGRRRGSRPGAAGNHALQPRHRRHQSAVLDRHPHRLDGAALRDGWPRSWRRWYRASSRRCVRRGRTSRR